MQHKAISIRPFIGARDYDESRRFYTALDFTESVINPSLSYFEIAPHVGFYLQKAYVKAWVDNTQLFVEVEDAEAHFEAVRDLFLTLKFPNFRLVPMRSADWGREYFLHDLSGILWHFGEFR